MADLHHLPSVDQLLRQPPVVEAIAGCQHAWAVGQARRALGEVRAHMQAGQVGGDRPALLALATRRLMALLEGAGPIPVRRVINATGVILHTGLGRAPLAPPAQRALAAAAEHYCALEFDLDTGRRGRRLDHVDERLQGLTGAEATAVVNNNAAAVLLMLHALAAGRDVVISRGQLVEIGGSFRMPDIIAASGARIREVGTTNRTHLCDYEEAIGPDTALLLVVHPSNYRIRGFTTEPAATALVGLGRRAGVPVGFDLGGGTLRDLAVWGLPHEPVVSDSLRAGFDIVTFSGDKILGGPQCGILAGRADLVERVTGSPMMRALRCDKLTLAALAATLDLYRLEAESLRQALPTLRMMTEPAAAVRARAEGLLAALSPAVLAALEAQVVPTAARAGSGALPVEELDSSALSCGGIAAPSLARRLRLDGTRPVLGRIEQERLLLDLRTVGDDEVEALAAALARAAGESAADAGA